MNLRVLGLFAMIGLAGVGHAHALTKLVIKGSNTYGEELGPRLIEVYAKVKPSVIFQLEHEGTATGFAGLLDGQCDIAAASRPANEDEERLARSRNITMKYFVIGYYGAALIVNASNTVQSLNDRQVREIFTGRVSNWKDVGGASAPVQLYIRDTSAGAHIGFQELAMAGEPYASGARQLKSNAEIAAAVAGDPRGIGYTGVLPELRTGTRLVRINGVLPTPESVNQGVYPYARQLRLYVNPDKESPAAKEFIRFVRSPGGQQLVTNLGFVRRIEPKVWPPPAE